MASRQDFELAFQLLLGHEGEYSADPRDPGNWTGPNMTGELRGTKWGISARAYPNIKNIKDLSQSTAHDLYFTDYWTPSGCPDLPPRLAFCHFDASVNNGPSRAVRWLQQAVAAPVDGKYGPTTRAMALAATAKDEAFILVEYQAHRLRFMSELATWRTFRGGWSRRLVKVPFEAAAYWPGAQQNV